MFKFHIRQIKAVLGSTTTEQQQEGNYPVTDITCLRQDVKTPMHTDPMEPENDAVWYNRTKK